jgi:purine-binding chemotaxis protein CheW
MTATHLRVRSGEEQYALPVEEVREIAPLGRVSPVPGAPAEVLGVWNLRGDVMAVIDLATVLGIAGGEASRIVVAEQGDLHAGLVVDEVIDICSLPEAREPVESEYLSGSVLVDRVPVGIVDVGAMLTGTAQAGR